ncbi:MAG: UDP-N-acetylmuramoyl-L-alanine--D-glutamate ligase [Actinobacteria bacterium]|nr:UDP-N-acetylmuramoyl-L-alanine--D-glutamate ligase [Actinomycetota bacterium]
MAAVSDKEGLQEVESVLVVGLGISGIAAAGKLLREGRKVTVNDISEAEPVRRAADELSARGARAVLGYHEPSLLGGVDLVVVSPGVPSRLALLREAEARKIPVWSEVELAWRYARGPVIAVTGTNGKTTTVSMIEWIFEYAGRPAIAAGNIGHPFITAVEEAAPGDVLVVEVSSFQLTFARAFKPAVAVLLNIAEDHFDWHSDMAEYVKAKARIWMNQGDEDVAVCNLDDPLCAREAAQAPSRVLYFSRGEDARAEIFLSGGRMLYRPLRGAGRGPLPAEIMRSEDLALPGEHNLENAMAAAGAAISLGIDAGKAGEALASFQGLSHRLQPVGEIDGVSFYNDSKATNPHAARCALGAFPGPLVVILGGRNKGLGFGELAGALRERGGIRAVYLIGEAAQEILEALRGGEETLNVRVLPGLEDVFAELPHTVESGDVVLFSPACASFDRYDDYKHRGRHFHALVEEYRKGRESGG